MYMLSFVRTIDNNGFLSYLKKNSFVHNTAIKNFNKCSQAKSVMHNILNISTSCLLDAKFF